MGSQYGCDEKLKGIRNTTPGPGNYDLESKYNGPSYIMKNDNSGYAHDKLNSNIAKTPAPGNYDPNNEIKFQNISYSMRSRTNKDKDNNVPGPGAYKNLEKKSSSTG